MSTLKSQVPSQPCDPHTGQGWELLVALEQKIPIFTTGEAEWRWDVKLPSNVGLLNTYNFAAIQHI